MSPLLLASALSALVMVQSPAPATVSPSPTPIPAPPAAPLIRTPTDDFGPDLKAWLEASKLKDRESASKALMALQRTRAARNLTSVDDLAGALSGYGEVRMMEGAKAEAVDALSAAIGFVPDSASEMARKAAVEGKWGDALGALRVAWNSPFERGRIVSFLLLGVLVIAAFFSAGFSLAVLLRYAAVFSHDVAEGLSGALKALALFMAVLFMALPLAGFMGWGYLPFWWIALFFIFQTRAEKAVSIFLLVALGLSSLILPMIHHQKSVDATPAAKLHSLIANGGTSAEGEALVKARLGADPQDAEWSLLSANLARRAGRDEEAVAALQAKAAEDPRFAHNLAAFELRKGNLEAALPGLTQVIGASLSPKDKATALYNLSLAQVNSLAFTESKESRQKGDALSGPALARYDRLFSFDRDGSILQAPPDIAPDAAKLKGALVPTLSLSLDDAFTRLTVIAVVLLLFIPGVVKFRGVQSFSKQCPKCGTTFCWLCQTRSTSQEFCSQCHYLFVVKRGIPPAARAAKNLEITRYLTNKALLHRIVSFAAPGAGHLAVGHVSLGFPVLGLWALCVGSVLTIHYLAPLFFAEGPLGTGLKTGFAVIALFTYVVAQAVKPQAPVVAPPPRRVPKAEQEAQ